MKKAEPKKHASENHPFEHLLAELLQKLCHIEEQIHHLHHAIKAQGEAMSAELDRLNASVAALSAADDTIIDLLNNAPTGAATAAEVNAVADTVDAEKAKVQAAIDAHPKV